MGVTATWVMALARSLPAFVFGMILYGLTAFVMSPLNSYVTGARGRLSVARALTIISAAYNSGAFFGPLIGGIIGKRFGLHRTYLFSGFVFIISTLMVFFLHHQEVEKRDSVSSINLLKSRTYLNFLGLIFIVMFALYLPQPLTPNYLQNQLGLDLSSIGWVGALGNLGNALLSLWLGGLPTLTGFLLGQVSVGLFSACIWLGAGLPWYLFGYFLLGGYRVARTLAIAQVREMVHQANTGLAFGVTETVSAGANLLASPLAGYIYAWNPSSIYPLTLGLIALGALFSARFAPRKQTAANG
jgi:MFS family permease